MSDVYKAPTASLNEQTKPFDGVGSLENGIAGNYDFSISGVLDESWKRVSGTKGKVWLTFLLYGLVSLAITLVIEFALKLIGLSTSDTGSSRGIAGKFLSQTLETLIELPMTASLMMLGIKLVVRAPVEVSEIFKYYSKIVPLILTTILMYLMVAIGFCLLILPGIYLSVSYYMALPLVLEKNLGPWEALEASRKALTHHWFKIFFTYIALVLIVAVSAIPLGIGLIWTVPMTLLVSGVLYRMIFGYEGEISVTPDPVAVGGV